MLSLSQHLVGRYASGFTQGGNTIMRWLLLIAPLALAACAAPSTPAVPTDDGQPKSGGSMSVRITNDPHDFDLSYNGKSRPMNDMQSQVNASLIGFKSAPDVDFNTLILRPELAERWDISPDARTFTFHLHKGLKFANLPPANGRELTSADVKWSLEYYSRSGEFKDKKLVPGAFEYFFEGLEAIETPTPQTAVVRFKDPFVPFINYAASDFNAIVAKEIYEQDSHHKDRVAGAGPFYLDLGASQKGTRWSLKKNPNYVEPGKPYIDEVRWLVIPEEATAIAAYQSKQLDYLGDFDLNRQTVEDLKKSSPSSVFYEYLFPGGSHVYMNVTRPPLDKLEVRKALILAIDREELSRTAYGKVLPGTPPGAFVGLFNEAEGRQLTRHDLNEAKRLLTQAGYPNGLDLQWEFSRADPDEIVSALQLMQAQLKKAGINVTFKVLEQAEWAGNRRTKDYTINLLTSTCGGQQEDQEIPLYGCYYSKNRANYGGVNDPELDKFLIAQRQETDLEKRRELQRQAVRRVGEMAWAFDLHYRPEWEAWHPHLKNFAPNAGNRGPNFVDSWLEK